MKRKMQKTIRSEEAVEKTLTLDYLVDMNIWMLSENGGNITADRFGELSRTEQAVAENGTDIRSQKHNAETRT